ALCWQIIPIRSATTRPWARSTTESCWRGVTRSNRDARNRGLMSAHPETCPRSLFQDHGRCSAPPGSWLPVYAAGNAQCMGDGVTGPAQAGTDADAGPPVPASQLEAGCQVSGIASDIHALGGEGLCRSADEGCIHLVQSIAEGAGIGSRRARLELPGVA